MRDLRWASLRDAARSGRPLALVNYRELIGVMIPVAAAWVEHLIDHNWSCLCQSIAEGEQAMISTTPMAALDDLIARAYTSPSGEAVARAGGLAAGLIEQADQAGQTIAVTHDRELIGIVIPITPGLVQFLIERNLPRVLHNIALGEKQLSTSDKLATLDELLHRQPPAGRQPRRPGRAVNADPAGRTSTT